MALKKYLLSNPPSQALLDAAQYIAKEDISQAIAYAECAHRLDPTISSISYYLAEFLQQTNRHQEAAHLFHLSSKQAGFHFVAEFKSAKALALAGERSKSIHRLRHLLKTDSNHCGCHLLLFKLLILDGRFTAAKKHLRTQPWLTSTKKCLPFILSNEILRNELGLDQSSIAKLLKRYRPDIELIQEADIKNPNLQKWII